MSCWFFGYPSGSAAALYCSGSFACRFPTWRLPARGHVHGLIAECGCLGEVSRAHLPGLVGGARVLVGRRILGSVRRVRLHKKTPAHLPGFGRIGNSQSRPRVWERLRVQGFVTMVPRFRGCIRVMRLMVLRTGWELGREFEVA